MKHESFKRVLKLLVYEFSHFAANDVQKNVRKGFRYKNKNPDEIKLNKIERTFREIGN